MHFLRWAKTHRRVRFDLTASGVPPARLADFAAKPLAVSLEAGRAYGDPEFLKAVAGLYGVTPESVVPVPGTSSANFIALATAVTRGACVMLERPCYEPLERVSRFLGLKSVPLERRPSLVFEVCLQEVEAGLSQGARALVLTNLHNPSGRWLSPEQIREIGSACSRADATLIVDEVYLDGASLVSGRPRWTAAGLADNILATNSLTKVYGLGGLRAGWLLARPELAERARDVMDILSVENAGPAMSLALQAFSSLEALENRFRRMFKEGQSTFRKWLDNEPLVQGYENFGAVFEWVKLPEGVDAGGFADLLAAEHDTQVVSGSFFGMKDHIRLGVALPSTDLAEALSRISEALNRNVKDNN